MRTQPFNRALPLCKFLLEDVPKSLKRIDELRGLTFFPDEYGFVSDDLQVDLETVRVYSNKIEEFSHLISANDNLDVRQADLGMQLVDGTKHWL